MAPLGTRVLIFEVPTKRRMFANHGVEGWYWGTYPEHYWCYTVYVSATRSERIINTVDFFPHNCPVTKLSSTDAARQSVEDLEEALNNIAPEYLFAVVDEQIQTIKTLQEILATYLPTSSPTTSPTREKSLILTTVPSTRVVPPPIPTTAPYMRVTITDIAAPRKFTRLLHPSTYKTAYRYALATQILTAQEACIHFETNAVIDIITGM